MPVPPNTSLPKTTAKAVERATIQSGMSTGMIIGISRPDTKKPSLTSWPRNWANANSMPKPTTYETTIRGSTLRNPNQSEAQNSGCTPCERKCM